MATFSPNKKVTVEFVEQDNPQQLALGSVYKCVVFTPANATGQVLHMTVSEQPDWQVRASAWNAAVSFIFSQPKSTKIHAYPELHPERLQGFYGWAHTSLFPAGTQHVNVDSKMIISPFTRHPKTGIRQYGSTWEWCRLYQISDYTFEARQDTTFTLDSHDQPHPLPWGTLKHIMINRLMAGVTVVCYLTVHEVDNGKGEKWIDNRQQEQAKWLLATLQSIADGTLTLDDAGHQYYSNRLFFSQNKQAWDRMQKEGIDKKVDDEVTQDAIRHNNGEEIVPSDKTVPVSGVLTPINMVPAGQWVPFINGQREQVIDSRSIIGRRRIAQYSNRYNGGFELKTLEEANRK